MENINSKKIRIQRAGSFLSRAQGKDIDGYFADAIQEVGPYFESPSSKRIGSGMTITEEKLLMPDLVGVQATDTGYLAKRDNYFATLSTKIPFKDGLELEMGLQDNTKPLSATNLPVNIAEYVRGRHITGHPWTASSEDAAKGNQLIRFYVFDAVSVSSNIDKVNEDKDAATAYYLGIKESPEKVNMMLTLLGTDPRNINGETPEHTTSLRKQELRKLVDSTPHLVKTLSLDKNFETKFLIQSMVNSGTLKVVGTRYIITETDEPIGEYEETVDYFRNEKNEQTIGLLKAKNQEAQKADKKVKRTVNAR